MENHSFLRYDIHMFSKNKTLSHYSAENATIWGSLAFQAGAINIGGFLACHRFVSHTTGFATIFAAELIKMEWVTALGMLSVPFFFLIGAMLSAFLVDTRIQSDKKPLYSVVFFILSSLLTAVALLGVSNKFGEFGAPANIFADYFLLASLAFASGLQNATVSSAFGAVVRTTHLTGITTDLAIGITRIFRRTHKLNSRENEIRANTMRASIIGLFVSGSGLSAYIYLHAEYWGFLIPASIAMILFLWSISEKPT